ncbi:MAG TPA: hypothetical protein VJ960_07990, partial [Oceanipulchritudo sp.]|nr:hypothetical protein [Oceanipulchritudo sp.]
MNKLFLPLALFLCALASAARIATDTPSEHPLGGGEMQTGGWFQSDWMGSVHTADYPWIYKPGAGWLYHFRAEGEDGHWWLDNDLGWIFTRESWYPVLHRMGSGTWLRHVTGTASP